MSIYRLDKLFAPQSVAVIGASARPGVLGHTVLAALRQGGFAGALYPVNPNYTAIDGLPCAASLEALPAVPDVVVVASPPATVPAIVESAGRLGCAAAIIITAGLGHGPGSLAAAARDAGRRFGLRLVGPNCLGVMAPAAGLNASFAARPAPAGDLAVISQSGAIAAGLVEWAAGRRVGLSGVVSLGDMVDVDFADCLDYFAADPGTRAILLYMEAIGDARKFMSAARAAARAKPVVVIKAGRHAPAAKAAATHTGALAGSDGVYEAAFRRAGLLRVLDLDDLFAAAETLGRQRPFPGNRLAILTNGGGLGVLAVDRLLDLGGELADLGPASMAALDKVLPPTWSKANPVDIIGDADAARYTAALEVLLADRDNDAVMVFQVPTALASAEASAQALVGAVAAQPHGRRKPVFAVWLGGSAAVSAGFEEAGIPNYPTEAEAIRGFSHLVHYREAQDNLLLTPDNLPADFSPDVAEARRLVAGVLADGRTWLDPLEVDGLLRCYSIPGVPVALARDADEAAAVAAVHFAKGVPVAVKILSPDIVHKSDVGGVALDLANAEALRAAVRTMLENVARLRPQARLRGVTVQPMISRPQACELIAGLADDPTFGPVVVFGGGGTAVEVTADKAMALPPLDSNLARDLVGRTRVARLLAGYRNVPAADRAGVELVLIKLAQLAADVPEIRELDINPLLADAAGVLALDTRVAVAALAPGAPGGTARFAVRPYPKDWERVLHSRGADYPVRPARPEDEGLVRRFLARVMPEDLRLRFFAPVLRPDHAFIARLIQIDYARAIAFFALDPKDGELCGVVRLHADADHKRGEFAILVRSDLKGSGLGWALMQLIIDWARADGIAAIDGEILAENSVMLELCRRLGFTLVPDAHGEPLVQAALVLPPP